MAIKYGQPPKNLDLIWQRIEVGDCWEWTGQIKDGYGYYASTPAYLLVWKILIGPVSAGLTLDHRCRNRPCVNPDHLEPVTRRVNTARSPIAIATKNAAKTHCPQGHEYTQDNTYNWPSAKTESRSCRECARINNKKAA